MVQMLDFCSETVQIWTVVGTVINIIKIVIPIIIVILAMLDLGKAVMAGEEKQIKEAQGMLVKRLIYGVVIFFVVTIVQVVFNLIGANTSNSMCWKCATNPGETGCYMVPPTPAP